MATSPTASLHDSVSSAASTADSVSSLEIRAKRFGPLLDIGDEPIISLALKVRNEALYEQCKPSPKHRLISRLNGSYNLVFIVEFDDGLKYVVRVPGTGWGDRFTDSAKKCFESQIMTMRLIHRETTIPIPEIYAFDASLTNDLGAPYMVMSFVPGSTVSELWFDKTGPTPIEDRRRRALETIAEAMSQLRKFQFNKIGSLVLTDKVEPYNKISIGPIYDFDEGDPDDENYGEEIKVEQSGPFKSSMSYLLYSFESAQGLDPYHWGLAAYKIVKRMLSHLPRSSLSPYSTCRAETFVLSLPDFDSQNVMIDEEGNLTGLIDWDNAQTYPRFLGYCCYPGFITRDWDPIMYGYPQEENENSPEELTRYRKIYFDKMAQMLDGKGDTMFVAKSHIFENLSIASSSDMNRRDIIRKVLREVLPDQDPYALMSDLGEGKLDAKVMKKLEKGLKELLSVKVPQRSWSFPSLLRRIASMFYVD